MTAPPAEWRELVPGTPTRRQGAALAYDSDRGALVLFGGAEVGGDFMADTWEFQFDGTTWAWTVVNTADRPSPRQGHAMAYDEGRKVVVLFGGVDGDGHFLGDTWIYEGHDWVEISPGTSPSSRAWHAMAYDASGKKTVLFGGSTDQQPHENDTWELQFDGTTWTWARPTLSSPPPGRRGHAMTYDTRCSQILLFGGEGARNLLDDTWVYNGTSWSQISTNPRPPARYFHALAYDAARDKVVLFGGWDDSTRLDDTWELDCSSGNWSQRDDLPTRPPARSHHVLAFDGSLSQVVLFGGRNDSLARFDDTWLYDGRDWQKVEESITRPPARERHALAYLPSCRYTILFGGLAATTWLSDTWKFDGASWQPVFPSTVPPARFGHDLTALGSGKLILFGGIGAGGGFLSDTWEYDCVSADWALIAPDTPLLPRAWYAMAYDSDRNVLVLFGGVNDSGELGDTWEFDGSAWTLVSVSGPSPRHGHTMAYDSGHKVIVLFGGHDGSTVLGDTWVYDNGTWHRRFPAVSPPARNGHGMAYDSTCQCVVLFAGRVSKGARFDDTWQYDYDEDTWQQASTEENPSDRVFHDLTYDEERHQIILFGGRNASYRINDTWGYGPPPLVVPGDLDPTFESDGRGTTAVGSAGDYGRSVAIQSDGRIVVAGHSDSGTNSDFAVVRYNSDGSLDTSFDSDGVVTTDVGNGDDAGYAVAIQPDGKIVVAGYSQNGSSLDFAVVRYNSDGSLDTSFGSGGLVTTPVGSDSGAGYSVAIQFDGKIVVAGRNHNGRNLDIAVVRYNNDGGLDASFGFGGVVTTPVGSDDDAGYAVAIQSDGKIVVAGYSYTGDDGDFAVVRYNSDGSLDASFGSGGIATTDVGSDQDNGRAAAIQSDGKIVVAGHSYNESSDYDFAVVRYNSDGSLDTSFGSGGIVTTAVGSRRDYGRAVAIQPDGKIVMAGFSHNGSNYDFAVVRYNSDGSLDTSFGSGGLVTTAVGSDHDLGRSVAIQSDGKIVVAGESQASNYEFAVVRYQGAAVAPCTLFADVDEDGDVDIADVQRVAAAWRASPPNPGFDLDGDGINTVRDIMQVVLQWGQTCP